jgi:hypothetical protein
LISQGLEKLPVFTGTVYRGMIVKRKEFDRIFGGDTVTQNRFVSSSKDMNVAFDFATRDQDRMKKNQVQVFLEIKSKNGRDISDISEFNGKFAPYNQQEIMFTNNTTFRIESRKITGNVVWVELKEI